MIYPPLNRNFVLPDGAITTDRGEVKTLGQLIEQSGDVTLFVPGFMSCHGVCPTLAQLYKGVVAKAKSDASVGVVFFSFDPNDTPELLNHFRQQQRLPENWHVVRASVEHTQELLSSLQYTVMKAEGGGYQHPAQAFVFTKNKKWVATLYGTDVTSAELTSVLSDVQFQVNHPTLAQTLAFVQSPDVLAVAGGSGGLFGLALLMWLATRHFGSNRSSTMRQK